MPCIKIIGAIKLYMYMRDHNPPHFHVKYAEYEELICIESLETYTGYLPNSQRKNVIAWATKSKWYLINKWNELNPNNGTK